MREGIYWKWGEIWLWCEWGRDSWRGYVEIMEAGQGKAWGVKMAAVEPAPEAKACEVDRIMD